MVAGHVPAICREALLKKYQTPRGEPCRLVAQSALAVVALPIAGVFGSPLPHPFHLLGAPPVVLVFRLRAPPCLALRLARPLAFRLRAILLPVPRPWVWDKRFSAAQADSPLRGLGFHSNRLARPRPPSSRFASNAYVTIPAHLPARFLPPVCFLNGAVPAVTPEKVIAAPCHWWSFSPPHFVSVFAPPDGNRGSQVSQRELEAKGARARDNCIQPPRGHPVTVNPMEIAGGMRLSKWRKIVGISRTTAWRLRKEGKLAVVVRYGQVYVTAGAIRSFFENNGAKGNSSPRLTESPGIIRSLV